MSDTTDSCLVAKLSHYMELDPASRSLLAALEKDEQSFERHDEVYRVGEAAVNLFVVKSGWLFASVDMPDGRRQIVRVYHPGDIIGFPDIAFDYSTVTIRTAEPVCLCPFPRRRLEVIFREAPRLTALMFSIALRDQAVFIDQLRATGRMTARERLAYVFLDLRARLRIAEPDVGSTFRLPLNQGELGDMLGLTNVYVSKTLGEMERDGLIFRREGRLTIIDEQTLIDLSDFVDRHASVDISWFPEA